MKGETMKKENSKEKDKGTIKWVIPKLRDLRVTLQTTSGDCSLGSVVLPALPCIPGTNASPSACIGGNVGN